jgi:hypothetical protein
MFKIFRDAFTIPAFLVITCSGYAVGQVAELSAADASSAESEAEPSPATETQPTEGRPDAARLKQDFLAWIEAGEHLPLVDARNLSMLELLDLDNAEFAWLSELKLRLHCEFKPDLEIPADDRVKTREQLQVLIADPQAGFLKQTLPGFSHFSDRTTEGRQHMNTVMTLVEAQLGAKSVAPPPPSPRPDPLAEREGSRERQGGIPPIPGEGGVEFGACAECGVGICDPCAALVACCVPSRVCGWLPRRRWAWGCCAAAPSGCCGGCCGPVVSWGGMASVQATRSAPGKPAVSPILISSADVIGVLAEGGLNPAIQLVSLTASADSTTRQERAIADGLFRLGSQAYWSGDYSRALEKLGMAADLNATDARIWYFTGLAQSALGQRQAATEALARAVQLHARQPRDRAILEALQRIQGRQRDELHRALLLAPGIRRTAPPAPKPLASDTPLIATTR